MSGARVCPQAISITGVPVVAVQDYAQRLIENVKLLNVSTKQISVAE